MKKNNKTNKEMLEFINEADFVFMVNFKENKQNLSIADGVPVQELLNTPFRLSLHLNQILETQLEGQTLETVAKNTQKEDS